MTNQTLRTIRRFFSAARERAGTGAVSRAGEGDGVFSRQAGRFGLAQGLIRGFYAFGLYMAVSRLADFQFLSEPSKGTLLWPVVWMAWVPAAIAPQLLRMLFLGGELMGLIFAGWRAGRVLAFLGWLEFVAVENSKVKIGHSLHMMVIVSFLLIFLPAEWGMAAARASRVLRQRTLLIFWACQAAIMLSYSMAGVSKFACAIYQMAMHQAHAFLPQALALHVAERLRETDSVSLLGGWLMHHPSAGWPLLPSTMYLQGVALWIAFRPSLQRLWAVGLILFHIGSYFTMTINFPQNCFLLGLFFFQSPFVTGNELDWRRMLADLPIFGVAARRLLAFSKKSSTLPALTPARRLELTAH